MTAKASYICKIASIEEMNQKWDDEIALHEQKENWIVWKDEAIDNARSGRAIPYYGILDGTIICEATVMLHPDFNIDPIFLDDHTVELCAFRTLQAYRGMGYFSQLKDFMLQDLKEKGYRRAIVGVEPQEIRNKQMYHHWGFTDFVTTGSQTYPDGTVIQIEFYSKLL